MNYKIVPTPEFIKEAKTRRARLYFMRKRTGKAAKLRDKFLLASDIEDIQKPEDIMTDEAIKGDYDLALKYFNKSQEEFQSQTLTIFP